MITDQKKLIKMSKGTVRFIGGEDTELFTAFFVYQAIFAIGALFMNLNAYSADSSLA